MSAKEDIDSYSLAIMAYMFAKLKNEFYYKRVMSILEKIAVRKGKLWYDIFSGKVQ